MPRVCSFDLDGCLFHSRYPCPFNQYLHETSLVDVNKHLLDAILHENMDEPLFVMLGSARQTHALDRLNSRRNQTESGFTGIIKVAHYLKAKIHPLLLSDVHRNLPSGTSFQRAMNHEDEGSEENKFSDKSKICLIYAEMHDFANLMPTAKVIFDFYDDRSQAQSKFPTYGPDILEHLGVYFSRYPEMVPHNFLLRLFHYEGLQRTLLYSIQGTGRVDLDYRHTVKRMIDLSKSVIPEFGDRHYYAASPFHISPDNLKFNTFKHKPRVSDVMKSVAKKPRKIYKIKKIKEIATPSPPKPCRYGFFAAAALLALTTVGTCYLAMEKLKQEMDP